MAGILISIIALFWGALVFDMLADVYGDVVGLIVSLVAVSMWFLIVRMTRFFLKRRGLRRKSSP